MRGILGLAGLALVLAGCGGGRLSQAELTSQANAICADINTGLENVREPKSVWARLNPVQVALTVTPTDKADGHFLLNANTKTDAALLEALASGQRTAGLALSSDIAFDGQSATGTAKFVLGALPDGLLQVVHGEAAALRALPPAFDTTSGCGSVTAGNASQLSDGASATLVMSDARSGLTKVSARASHVLARSDAPMPSSGNPASLRARLTL